MADFICLPPDNIEASWNGSAVVLTWTGSAISYTVRYREGTGAWTYPPAVYGLTITIGGLIPGRVYAFDITSNCPTEDALSDRINFMVPSGLAGPSNLTMVSKTATSATISWTGPAGDYGIQWQDLSTMEVFYDITQTPPYTIYDLTPGLNYKITVARLYQDDSIPPVGVQYLDKDLCCS